MKKLSSLFFLFFLLIMCSCLNDKEEEYTEETVTYEINEPVLRAVGEIRQAGAFTAPKKMTEMGKMCFYKDYLYVSAPGEGIHIIDNRQPSAPCAVGFVELPGTYELAIRADRLYADSYIDLVWFDLSDPARPEVKGRVENVFEQVLPPTGNERGYDYGRCYAVAERADSVVVGWKLVTRTETYRRYPGYVNDGSNTPNGGGASEGLNGSTSRFGLYQSYLYVIGIGRMHIFDLAGAQPVRIGADIALEGMAETIFTYKDCLFMGTPAGMLIYSLQNPLAPEYCSTVRHIYGCDPVVVENDRAYVTVHSGNACGQSGNLLQVVDVSDVKWPVEIVSYTMTKPLGLGIDRNTLFVCDDGLKVYRTDDPQQLMANCLLHAPDIKGYDVIPAGEVLIVMAEDGLYQYDYTDLNRITLLSKLPVGE